MSGLFVESEVAALIPENICAIVFIISPPNFVSWDANAPEIVGKPIDKEKFNRWGYRILFVYFMSSPTQNQPVDTTAETINLIPIPRRKSTHGMFRTGESRRARLDVSRELTESSKDYMVQRLKEELSSFSPTAAVDIQELRKTVLHLGEIVAKNTGERITAKTNEESQIESDEDEGVRTLWSSILWSNGSARSIPSSGADPFDPKFSYFGSGATGSVSIDGVGKASVINGNAPVIWIGQTNYNCTVTMNTRFGTGIDTVDINLRNRGTASCQFYGYTTSFQFGGANGVYFLKIPVSGIVSDPLSSVNLSTLGITLSPNTDTWIRAKIEGRPDTSVRVSAYIMKDGEWKFVSSYTDNDANEDSLLPLSGPEATVFSTCAASGDMITSSNANMIKPWRKPGQQIYIQAYSSPYSDPVGSWVINSLKMTSP
jgi:hypothetical protein